MTQHMRFLISLQGFPTDPWDLGAAGQTSATDKANNTEKVSLRVFLTWYYFEISFLQTKYFFFNPSGDVGSVSLIKKLQNWHIGLLICSHNKDLLKLFLWAFSRFFPSNKKLLVAFSGRWICSFTIAHARSIRISRSINPFDLLFVLINLLCKRECRISQDESLLSPCCALIPSHLPWLIGCTDVWGCSMMGEKGEIFRTIFTTAFSSHFI